MANFIWVKGRRQPINTSEAKNAIRNGLFMTKSDKEFQNFISPEMDFAFFSDRMTGPSIVRSAGSRVMVNRTETATTTIAPKATVVNIGRRIKHIPIKPRKTQAAENKTALPAVCMVVASACPAEALSSSSRYRLTSISAKSMLSARPAIGMTFSTKLESSIRVPSQYMIPMVPVTANIPMIMGIMRKRFRQKQTIKSGTPQEFQSAPPFSNHVGWPR